MSISDITIKIISEVTHLSFNASVKEGTFPSVFKLADVIPILKKGSKNSKDHYRPISILKNLLFIILEESYMQITTPFVSEATPENVK